MDQIKKLQLPKIKIYLSNVQDEHIQIDQRNSELFYTTRWTTLTRPTSILRIRKTLGKNSGQDKVSIIRKKTYTKSILRSSLFNLDVPLYFPYLQIGTQPSKNNSPRESNCSLSSSQIIMKLPFGNEKRKRKAFKS